MREIQTARRRATTSQDPSARNVGACTLQTHGCVPKHMCFRMDVLQNTCVLARIYVSLPSAQNVGACTLQTHASTWMFHPVKFTCIKIGVRINIQFNTRRLGRARTPPPPPPPPLGNRRLPRGRFVVGVSHISVKISTHRGPHHTPVDLRHLGCRCMLDHA